MNNTPDLQRSPWRYLWLVALLALPALGWYGVLDEFSSRDINAAISNAGVIYGTARGINALVSLLQGTELSIPFLTFSIGEVLDPVNDLIEQFSDIILIALGSLALQKILLAVVSHTMFNVLLTIVAALTGLAFILGNHKSLSMLLRTFLVIAFFRFSLGLVVLANSWVDARFLDEADQQRHIAMANFQGKLRQIDTLSKQEDEAVALLAEIRTDLAKLEADREASENELDVLSARIELAAKELETLSNKAGGLCEVSSLSPTCPDDVKNAKSALDKLQLERKNTQSSQATIEKASEDLREQMTCLQKRQQGDNCSFLDSLPDVPDTVLLRNKLNEVNASLSDFAENSIDLLVSLLLKTVAIPLLFVLLLLKIVRMTWSKI